MGLWKREAYLSRGGSPKKESTPVLLGTRRALITFLCIMGIAVFLLILFGVFLH